MLDPDLPDELHEQEADQPPSPEEQAAHYSRLQAIGQTVARKRDAAVKARKASGIEDVWTYCEEAYGAIDPATGGGDWRKPTSPSGPLMRASGKADDTRSTVFMRLTTRYVDMGAAKVKERAIPLADRPFDIQPTPEPDLVATLEQEQTMAQPAPNPGTAQPAALSPAAQAAKQLLDTARSKAEKASDRIWDWWAEAKYARHIRRVIDDGARIGVGVLKGPFPDEREQRAVSTGANGVMLEVECKTQPGMTSVDPWRFYPDPNCGEDIHEGDYVLEEDFFTTGKLEGLKDLKEPGGEPVFLGPAIDKVIAEGPGKCNVERREVDSRDTKSLFQVWHFTGQLSRQDMIDLGALGAEELPAEVVHCHAIVTLVNDTVIRAQFNPVTKTGHFPYRVFNWSRRAGFWAGVGVGEQVAVPQKMVNAATRAWMNNAGVSAGVQLVKDPRLLPMDGSYTIGGGVKMWEAAAEAAGVDVRTLLAAIEIPNRGDELKAIVDYAYKTAEELSNIPLITQGQDGNNTPQTFGQAELQNSNGNTLLRSIADTLDGDVIEPMVGDFYEVLLLDPDVPDDEKGDFQIVARGCSAMVEKAIQEQTLLQVGQMTLNPAYELSPANWAKTFLRAKRIDPDQIRYDDQDLAAMKNAPPQDAPAVAAAKINAATRVHVQDMANTAELQRVQQQMQYEQQALQTGAATPHGARAMSLVESTRIRAASAENIENSRAFAERERAQKELEIAQQNGQFKLQEMALEREIALLNYANQQKLSIDSVKAQLAKAAMDNQTKRELAAAQIQLAQNEGHADRLVDLHKHHNPTTPQPAAADPTGQPETAPA